MLNQVILNDAASTVAELAAAIKYHPESVRRAIRQGRIYALPFGTRWRIPAAEVRRILTSGLPFRSPATVL
jgi:excisionase family DNA binding protein